MSSSLYEVFFFKCFENAYMNLVTLYRRSNHMDVIFDFYVNNFASINVA